MNSYISNKKHLYFIIRITNLSKEPENFSSFCHPKEENKEFDSIKISTIPLNTGQTTLLLKKNVETYPYCKGKNPCYLKLLEHVNSKMEEKVLKIPHSIMDTLQPFIDKNDNNYRNSYNNQYILYDISSDTQKTN